VLSTATAYDLDPCMAKERSKLKIRMRKIVELVLTCKGLKRGQTPFGYVRETYSRPSPARREKGFP
jgi:hypothetical protein